MPNFNVHNKVGTCSEIILNISCDVLQRNHFNNIFSKQDFYIISISYFHMGAKIMKRKIENFHENITSSRRTGERFVSL